MTDQEYSKEANKIHNDYDSVVQEANDYMNSRVFPSAK